MTEMPFVSVLLGVKLLLLLPCVCGTQESLLKMVHTTSLAHFPKILLCVPIAQRINRYFSVSHFMRPFFCIMKCIRGTLHLLFLHTSTCIIKSVSLGFNVRGEEFLTKCCSCFSLYYWHQSRKLQSFST